MGLGNFMLNTVAPVGLGAIQGMRQAKQDQWQDEDRGMRREEMGLRRMTLERQQKEQERMDRERALEEEAQAEAARVFQERVAAGKAKAATGLGGVMQPGVEPEYQPSKDDMLDAGDAYAKFWLSKGKVDKYMPMEKMRRCACKCANRQSSKACRRGRPRETRRRC
jgi:hypothetical protein